MTSQLKTDLFADIFAAIQSGEKRIKINGLWGSSEAFFLSRLLHHGASFCLITPSFSDAQQMHQEVSFFTQMGNVQNAVSLPGLFPPSDILPDEQTQSRPDWMAARLSLLYPLAAGRPVSLVTSALALRQTVINKSFLLGQSEQFKVGDTVDRDLIIEHLHRNGYERIESVTQPGEFAVRGGIVDLYSPVQSGPVRIELSDDTIVSIRTFDPVSQKSIDGIDTIMVIPWRENHPAAGAMSLSDYLSPQTVLIYDEPDAVRLALENAPTRGGGLPAGEGVTIDLEALSIGSDRGAKRFTFDIPSLSSLGLERFGQSFSEVTQRLNQLRSDHFIIVVVRTQTQLERFQRLFNDYDIPFTQEMDHVPTGHNAAGSFTPREGAMPIFLTMGNISEGFLLPQSKMIFLTDELLSGHLGKRRSMTETKDPRSLLLSSLSDLKPYDFVVHIAHGIGRYLGLKRLSTSLGYGRETYETDCLMLQYAGGSNLYVPLESLKLVSKYIGSEGVHPPLDTLGGTRWARAKEKVKKTIQEMTGELLTLYAERKIVEGHSFRLTPHLDEFAAAFEYEETPDQLLAIEAIIDDMQGKKPMDRLICGDVGYGKTEVAMRGAFLAAMDNKQVAVVVPTTLLARQHGETFTKRFAPFPVSVAVLSRLSSRREQTKILSDLEKGAVDIVIATHRVFQKDVAFRDLGLVIVDEEHRFGVRHKEKLKQMRKKVDVLTLTATPIPRTLQMALAQTRDLTVIETAPANRLSIRTLLASFEPKLIREVIFRELVRGGQVFFVHNRVNDIGQIGVFLSDLIPEARICIAHGQMRPKMLEDIMMQFLAKKYNVLVTTTIIESGIDIPSANTIIINNADLFGLAELYQLRGRVGRSNEQAYAYLLVQDGKVLTETAEKRLQTLQEFTELGDGFRIAARDLEIRGAGNLLGSEQSGPIAAVGFDLYLKMIDETVRELKGCPVEKEIETTIQLNCSSYIPEEYMPDSYQRLTFYRRLSTVRTLSEVDLIHEEMIDRYGPMPDTATNLCNLVKLKKQAVACRVIKIVQEGRSVRFHLDESAIVEPEYIDRLLNKYKNRIRFLSPLSFEVAPAMPPQGKAGGLHPTAPHQGKMKRGGEERPLGFIEIADCLATLLGDGK